MKIPTKWYYRPWIVVLLLFFVLGPFGLPLVYKSPRFSKFWKIVLTLLVILFTIEMIHKTYQISKTMIEKLYEAGLVQ